MKLLSDPRNDRVVKTLKPPPHEPLSEELLWETSSKSSNLIRQTKLEKYKRSFEMRGKIKKI